MTAKPLDMPCPACREVGKDTSGDNLRVFPSGKFHCIATGSDIGHNRRIIELAPELGKRDGLKPHAPRILRPMPRPVRLDLLARIKHRYPASVRSLQGSSPASCTGTGDDTKAFLPLFPAEADLWIAPSVRSSGYPEAARFFRKREEWEAVTLTSPGMRIAPSVFKPGSVSRSAASVAEHLFVVVESDEIGDGKIYRDKDDFCSLIRWLREGCDWKLAAVVDTGGKSFHAWLRYPGADDMAQLAVHAKALGIDSKFAEPAQPWRLPGVRRENAETWQTLIYLDREAAL